MNIHLVADDSFEAVSLSPASAWQNALTEFERTLNTSSTTSAVAAPEITIGNESQRFARGDPALRCPIMEVTLSCAPESRLPGRSLALEVDAEYSSRGFVICTREGVPQAAAVDARALAQAYSAYVLSPVASGAGLLAPEYDIMITQLKVRGFGLLVCLRYQHRPLDFARFAADITKNRK